jgi:hypothetical protein
MSTESEVGAPHFRTEARKYRNANYTFEKVINEAIDNIIKKATEIHVKTTIDGDGRLQEVKISDNYVNGFENINQKGVANPFNMGHKRPGHDANDELSEFGVGMKSGALSAANELSVLTKAKGSYYHVIMPFLKMEEEEDVNTSYNPKIKEIVEADYREVHPFATGSSVILSKIRDTICERTTQRELTERLKKGISETYSRFLTANMRIFVNGEEVSRELDFFADIKCVLFTIKKRFFILEKGNDAIFVIKKTIEQPTWQIYVKGKVKGQIELKDKWETLKQSGEEFMAEKIKEGYKYCYDSGSVVSDGSCMKIDTIFTFYSDLFHQPSEPEKPFDHVLIYKDNRKYAKKTLAKIVLDGNHNYTLHRIDFDAKQIGKALGMTFYKDMTMEGNNDLIRAVKLAIDDSRKEFSSNVSNKQNEKSCDKAIKNNVINLNTCNPEKLSTKHRKLREAYDLKVKDEIEKAEKQALIKAANDKKEADRLAAIQLAKEKEEADRLAALQVEKDRLEALERETPEERATRLAAEKAKRDDEEKRRLAALKLAKEKEELERLAALKLAKEKEELERFAKIKLAKEEEERQKLAIEKAKRDEEERQMAIKERLERLKSQQEESRARLREASQLLMMKHDGEDLISLDDSNGILNKIKELLKM